MRLGKHSIIAMVCCLTLVLPVVVMAGSDHDHHMDHSNHVGQMIHESTVDGYSLAYHVIDMKEKMAGAEGMVMEGHDMSQMKSHHMMLYVTAPNGKKVLEGKVGYMVAGPDGSNQKAMAMAMKGAFGADVDLSSKGSYTIKAKIIAGEQKLMDSFSYQVD